MEDQSIFAAVEAIQSQAPAKEPKGYPTVGFENLRNIDPDNVADAIQQAFDEGYARAMWEVDQQLQPVASRIEDAEAELERMTTWLNGDDAIKVTWENPDGPQAA